MEHRKYYSPTEELFLTTRKQHFLVHTITDLVSCRRVIRALKTNIVLPDYSIFIKVMTELENELELHLNNKSLPHKMWRWDTEENEIRCHEIEGYLVG